MKLIMANIFNDFNDVADEVTRNVPSVTYKFRDWNLDIHKSVLEKSLIWLSHPNTLNDPYDIRLPVRFNFDEVNNPLFFEKLKLVGREFYYWLSPDSRDFKVLIQKRFEEIKKNPKKYFEDNYRQLRDSNVYDVVGVFSLCKNFENETMWANYANNAEGFCIGYNTKLLLQHLNLNFGHVIYNDIPPLHSLLKRPDLDSMDQLYQKHTKWSNEDEFRLITSNINQDKDRLKVIPEIILEEVILGEKMPNKHTDKIIEILKSKYLSKVKLYQAYSGMSYGYKRKEVSY